MVRYLKLESCRDEGACNQIGRDHRIFVSHPFFMRVAANMLFASFRK
jgi:hypothetical protein